MPTVTGTSFPISLGSTSTWMIFACGANVAALPVTLSSNREPTFNSTSQRWIARFTCTHPCIPGMPSDSG